MSEPDGDGVTGRSGAPPNVVLVVLDTVRAEETIPPRAAWTPTLAGLAEAGTVYTNAFATAPWTLPSHASLFTGTYPSSHGAHGHHPRLTGDHRTLAESFADAGYETAAVSNNTWITDQFGFGRGFETFAELWADDESATPDDGWPGDERGGLTESLAGRLRSVGAELGDRFPLSAPGLLLREDASGPRTDGADRTTQWLTRWFESRGDRPFFCFANYIDAHLAYRPAAEYAEQFLPAGWSYEEATSIRQDPRAFDVDEYDLSHEEFAALRGLYRGEIARLDDQLGRLREALEAAGHWEDTLFVVVGDHGENVGDHEFLGHQYNLYDTLLHVPLFVSGGAFDGQGAVDDLVQLTDLAPTLLDAAGIEDDAASAQYQGRSFHPGSSSSPRDRVYAEYIAPRPSVATLRERFDQVPGRVADYDRTLRSVRTRDRKLIWGSDGHRELYDVATDPEERVDRARSDPEAIESLEADLESRLDSFEHAEMDGGGGVDVDASAKDRLEDLGQL